MDENRNPVADDRDFAYRLDDYDYDLPESLIAQKPSARRDASRLLVLDRAAKRLEHCRFDDVLRYLEPGDVLVVNDTRVVPARLHGTKESGGRVELLILDPYKDPDLGSREGYHCLVKASKRTQPESLILLDGGIRAKVVSPLQDGKARVLFLTPEPFLDVLHRIGEVPLPPYIRRNGEPPPVDDLDAYQTVYAQKPGAVAAPTAGLHFSRELLGTLENRGIELLTVTLHVGYGTFAPIRAEDVREHQMHAEYAEIGLDTAQRIQAAKREGRRVLAVGTTVVRALEWVACRHGTVVPFSGFCNHYIFPGYTFRVVDRMITNFHLPRSTLLLLVSAFAGRGAILSAYGEAISHGYRYFSYGDAMLIL